MKILCAWGIAFLITCAVQAEDESACDRNLVAISPQQKVADTTKTRYDKKFEEGVQKEFANRHSKGYVNPTTNHLTNQNSEFHRRELRLPSFAQRVLSVGRTGKFFRIFGRKL